MPKVLANVCELLVDSLLLKILGGTFHKNISYSETVTAAFSAECCDWIVNISYQSLTCPDVTDEIPKATIVAHCSPNRLSRTSSLRGLLRTAVRLRIPVVYYQVREGLCPFAEPAHHGFIAFIGIVR